MMWWLLFPLFILLSCNPKGPHKPILTTLDQKVGFDQVRPIFAKHCASCHPSRSGPDWLDYNQSKLYVNNGRLVQRVVIDRTMPPPNTAESAAMDEKDRQTIAHWAQSGALEWSEGAKIPRTAILNPALQNCFQCHGVEGPGSEADPKIPRIGGQMENYLVLQLRKFKWRERLDPTDRMNEAALNLSEKEIREIALYFSQQYGMGLAQRMEVPSDEKAFFNIGMSLARQSCNTCHMSERRNYMPSSEWTPILRGQSKQYLVNQLLYFRNNERVSPFMHEMAKSLTNAEIESVSVFYSLY